MLNSCRSNLSKKNQIYRLNVHILRYSTSQIVFETIARYVYDELIPTLDGPVMVTLDSMHDYETVWRELLLYGHLVSVGSYLIVQDIKMDEMYGTG